MKELSIEAKAKRYNEAIEIAKSKIKNDKDHVFYESDVIDIFPELYESEDERIRKWIIAQLEIKSDVNNSRELELMILKSIAWLEKQGEQKPVDKVEPKFKVGDWVVLTAGELSTTLQIANVDINKKLYLFKDGSYLPIVDEECLHLWTIEDAKDGDVLVYGDNPNHNHVEVIMLFKSVRNERSAFTHFHIFIDQFRIDDWCDCGKNVHPATKEQRDLLFQKMKEAGYEWDAEKKELKKIEQTIEIPFGAKDSELQEATYYIPDGYHAEINGNAVVIKKKTKK